MSRHGSSRRALVWSISWRFARGHRSRLLAGTARAALGATALGVAAMVIAMALMTGYREDLQGRLTRGNAAVVVYSLGAGGPSLTDGDRRRLLEIPAVQSLRKVTYGQGALAGGARPLGVEVTLRGVDPRQGLPDLERVELVSGVDPGAGLELAGMPVVIVGDGLAERLQAEEGEALRLMVLGFDGGAPSFRYRSVRLGGTFTTGFSEFDQSWALMDRLLLEELMGAAAETSMLEIGVVEAGEAPRVAEQVRAVLGPGYLVSDWQELNRELFTALRVQQIALFFVLGLIVLVSTFNVASTLVVLVRERMRDVGVLAALGLSRSELRSVFLWFGGILGMAGTLCGLALGSAVSWVVTRFELIRFDPEVAAIYFIRSVPFRVRSEDLLAITLFTLVITLVACWLPSRRAGRLPPAVALRYE